MKQDQSAEEAKASDRLHRGKLAESLQDVTCHNTLLAIYEGKLL